MIRKILLTFFVVIYIGAIAACSSTPASPTAQANMPNPASVYCEEHGGKLNIVTASDGSQSGVCTFPDNSTCDEWAYFRGECKPGDSLTQPNQNTATIPSTPIKESQIVFYSNRGGGYNQMYMLDIGTSTLTQLTTSESNSFAGPFSPDGKQILFTGFGLTHSYIGVMNADGSGQADLTQQPNSDEAFPAWSPDGKQIVFTSRRDGNNEIYLMNADGSNPKRLTNNPKDDFTPVWSPDGMQIVFVSDRDNQTGINSLYMIYVDGTSVKRLTNDSSNDYAPAWSPDGTQIVYQSVRNGQADIYVLNIESAAETNLTNNPADDSAPRWSPDGKQIAFQTNRDGNWEIYVMNADGSNLINLTQNPADDQLPYWKP